MQFNVTKEWLLNKLAEMEAAGVDETCCTVGTDVLPKGIVVRAKMRCNTVQTTGSERHPNRNIQLGAVFSNDPQSENKSFANATPSGSVMLNIDPGRPAADAFELGAEYYVDFIPCGIPERRYIGDGIDPLEAAVMVTNRDGSLEAKATYDGKSNNLSVEINGELFTGSPYGCEKLRQAGYTHWRYLRDGE